MLDKMKTLPLVLVESDLKAKDLLVA